MTEKKLDKKTEVIFRTVESLKLSAPIFKEFAEVAGNYKKASLKLSEEGKKMTDVMFKLAALQTSDIGEAISKLAEIHKNVELKRETMCRVLQDDLIAAITRGVKTEESDISQFEAGYKKSTATARAQIAKLEGASKKAAKKGASALQESIRELDTCVKEADKVKAEKLRAILLIERRKYCSYLAFWNQVLTAEIEMLTEASKLKDSQSYFTNLASSSSTLPPDMETLISTQSMERTFVQIQSSDDGAAYSGQSDQYSATYDESGYGYDLGTATALYDFAGDQPSDLPFFAGEVITITVEDDGSGWLAGELNGRRGIFPASYVQRERLYE